MMMMMLKYKLLLLNILLIFVIVYSKSLTINNMPIIMWSNQNSLPSTTNILSNPSNMNQLNEYVDMIRKDTRPDHIINFRFQQIKNQAELLKYIGAYDNNNSNQPKFPILKDILSQDKSSIWTTVNNNYASVFQSENAHHVNCDNIDMISGLHATDLLIDLDTNNMNNIEKQEKCIEKVLSLVAKEDQSYVGIISTTQPSTLSLNENTVLLEEAADAGAGVQYITPDIVFGLLLGFILLLMLMCGLSCMMSIQTPLRFPSRKMPINKEF